jgi:hypothetical protein
MLRLTNNTRYSVAVVGEAQSLDPIPDFKPTHSRGPINLNKLEHIRMRTWLDVTDSFALGHTNGKTTITGDVSANDM